MKKIIPILLMAACMFVGCKQNEPEQKEWHVYLTRYEIQSIPYEGAYYYGLFEQEGKPFTWGMTGYKQLYSDQLPYVYKFEEPLLLDWADLDVDVVYTPKEPTDLTLWSACLQGHVRKSIFDSRDKMFFQIADNPEPGKEVPYTIIYMYFDYKYE